MTKKLVFSIVFCITLFFGFPTLAFIYERTPEGYTIENPVNFYVEWEYIEGLNVWEIELYCTPEIYPYWGLRISRTGEDIDTNCVEQSVLANNWNLNLPLGMWDAGVWLNCCYSETELGFTTTLRFEENFEVIETELPVAWFSSDFIDNVFAYVGGLINDLDVAIILLVGIALAMAIITFILTILDERKWRKEWKDKTGKNW